MTAGEAAGLITALGSLMLGGWAQWNTSKNKRITNGHAERIEEVEGENKALRRIVTDQQKEIDECEKKRHKKPHREHESRS